MDKKNYHDILKSKIDEYIHTVYKITRKFPKEELFGITSQIRRASISIMLNYVEGYARMKSKVYKNFLEISYGSLKETKYLLEFSKQENLITLDEYKKLKDLNDEIGAMLWGILRKLK